MVILLSIELESVGLILFFVCSRLDSALVNDFISISSFCSSCRHLKTKRTDVGFAFVVILTPIVLDDDRSNCLALE